MRTELIAQPSGQGSANSTKKTALETQSEALVSVRRSASASKLGLKSGAAGGSSGDPSSEATLQPRSEGPVHREKVSVEALQCTSQMQVAGSIQPSSSPGVDAGPVVKDSLAADSASETTLELHQRGSVHEKGAYCDALPETPQARAETKSLRQRGTLPLSDSPMVVGTEGPPAEAKKTKKESSKRKFILSTSRKVFNALDGTTSMIPVVGTCVGAVAKVGASLIEIAETVEGNEDMSAELTNRASKLSELLKLFGSRWEDQEGDKISEQMMLLRSEIDEVKNDIQKWKNSGRLSKYLSASEHREILEGFDKMMGDASKEMDLMGTISITDRIEEILNDRYLDRLGRGDYGEGVNSIKNTTCLAGTRVAALGRIDDWMLGSERVLWVRGMAGRGKSTVARTVEQRWRFRGAAVAVFYIRRDRSTKENREWVCGLSRQLMRARIPKVSRAILASARNNPDIRGKPLPDQFEQLLKTPLITLEAQSQPVLLIVDALDEFHDAVDAKELIDLISEHATSLPPNVKFLLTSRPERTLITSLNQCQVENMDSLEDNEADVRVFIEARFAAINQMPGAKDKVGENWPSRKEMDLVANMAQGLFQWAYTAMAYIGEGSHDIRLKEILASPALSGELDPLYLQILSNAFNRSSRPDRQELMAGLLRALIVAPQPITADIIAYLYGNCGMLQGLKHSQIIHALCSDILGDLKSLVLIPENPAEQILLLHTSIRDFLIHNGSSLQAGISFDVIGSHRHLRDLCLGRMERDLIRNICDLSNISEPISEVRTIVDEKKNLLNWLEIMSSIEETEEAGIVAHSVYEWLIMRSTSGMCSPSQDYGVDCNIKPNAILLIRFSANGRLLIVKTGLFRHEGPTGWLWDLESKTSIDLPQPDPAEEVSWIQVSPNNDRIAILTWSKNSQSNACPDSWHSHSRINVIRVWSLRSGSVVGKPSTLGAYLEPHLKYVDSAAFSPDGRLLAYVAPEAKDGRCIHQIRVWDVESRSAISLIDLPEDVGQSIKFSPNGHLLLAYGGVLPSQFRLFDVRSPSPTAKAATSGRLNRITSATFSPDGKTIVTSDETTCHLWDLRSLLTESSPIPAEHTIRFVIFSPDTKMIACWLESSGYQFWDVKSGSLVSQLPEDLEEHKVLESAPGDSKATLPSTRNHGMIRRSDEKLGSPSLRDFVETPMFSPDSKLVVCWLGRLYGDVIIWDIHAKRVVEVEMDVAEKDGIWSGEVTLRHVESAYDRLLVKDLKSTWASSVASVSAHQHQAGPPLITLYRFSGQWLFADSKILWLPAHYFRDPRRCYFHTSSLSSDGTVVHIGEDKPYFFTFPDGLVSKQFAEALRNKEELAERALQRWYNDGWQ
ncbi:hypothetical protein FRB90_003045 [Tulasnella sp. 427]|nr:hypothetical protein FRB90_003045 [Tulasnella sp. 427]